VLEDCEEGSFDVCPIIEDWCKRSKSSLCGIFINACHSEELVSKLPSLQYAICTTAEITDNAAIVFAEKFYLAIGSKETLQDAYRLSRASLEAEKEDPSIIKLHQHFRSATKERVQIAKEHSGGEGGGYTRYVPSLQRESQTIAERLDFAQHDGERAPSAHTVQRDDAAIARALQHDRASPLPPNRHSGEAALHAPLLSPRRNERKAQLHDIDVRLDQIRDSRDGPIDGPNKAAVCCVAFMVLCVVAGAAVAVHVLV
jgi:hypothetical protein